jgi:hypothetical protein
LAELYLQPQLAVGQRLDTRPLQTGMVQAAALVAAAAVMTGRHTRQTAAQRLLVKEMQEELETQAHILWVAAAAVLVQSEATP